MIRIPGWYRPPLLPHGANYPEGLLWNVDSHTSTRYAIKAKQHDTNLTFHKYEQTETSDLVVSTSDPFINRLRQHTFSTALSQFYWTRSGKSSSRSSETRLSRHSTVTARRFPLYVHSPTDLPSKRVLQQTLHSAAVRNIIDFHTFADISMIYTFCDTIY